MSTGPTEYEIRSVALMASATANAGDNPLQSTVLADAKEYASWLREAAMSDEEHARRLLENRIIQVQGATPIKARLLTEEEPENIWGGPCATCGHSTGVHLHTRGCEHPDGCECAWPDTSAPEKKKLIVPECGLCGAPWSDVHGQPGDPCSAPAPEPTSASALGCTCEHGRVIHNEHGCGFLGGCECTWKYA